MIYNLYSNTKSVLEICKGVCFFIYCPLLPLWWIVEWVFTMIRRKLRQARRRKVLEKRRAQQKDKEHKTFLMLDKFTRGAVEKRVFDFDEEKKKVEERSAKRKQRSSDSKHG